MLTYDDLSALRAAGAPPSELSAVTRGHTLAGDGGGSEFYWDASSTAADDGGSVILPDTHTGAGRWRLKDRSTIRGAQFGAFGDGSEVGTRLSAAFAAIEESGSGAKGALLLQGGTYLMDSASIAGKHVHVVCVGGPVVLQRTSSAVDRLIVVSGTLGAFHELGADALAGRNTLVCATLASSLAEGALLQITSSASFEPTTDRKQGELATVRETDGDVIYLTQPLHDTYLKDPDDAKIAVVDPGSFSVSGRLVIERAREDDPNVDTYGIKLAYLDSPQGTLEFRNIQAAGLSLYSCWRPDFHVDAINHARRDQDEGQPILVMNSTMYGRFTGTVAYARHAYASGASGDYHGVPWENRVTMTGISGTGVTIFDAHPQVGSTYFDGCVAISGVISDLLGTVSSAGAPASATSVPTAPLTRSAPQGSAVLFSGGETATLTAAAGIGNTSLSVSALTSAVSGGESISSAARAGGFSLGGRYNYVSNARCVGTAFGVAPRSDARTVRVIDVDGIVMQECGGGAFHFNSELSTTVGTVSIRGVRGQVGTGFAVALLRGTILNRIEASDIHVEGKLLFIGAAANVAVPAQLELSNAASRFSTPQTVSIRAVDIQNAAVKSVQLHDVYSEAGELLRTTSAVDLDLLEIIGGGGKQAANRYVNLEGGCEVCVLRGGSWEDTQAANSGIVRTNAIAITYLEIAPARTSGTNLSRALSAAIGTTVAWYRMDGNMPSVTTELSGVAGNPIQLLAGNPNFPRITRSGANPTHAAPIASKHYNSGGAPGAQEWIQAGPTSTSWIALH